MKHPNILTPNFTLLTFLEGFHEEIDEDDHTKQILHVGNMVKIHHIIYYTASAIKNVDFSS